MDKHQKIRIDISVRFRDIDAMGHVNNAVFFTYFEEGRKAFIGRLLGIVKPSEYYFILARIECEFLQAITLEDRPVLEIWVGRIGGKSFTFKYRIIDGNGGSSVYARGESVQVFYDYEEGKAITAPSEFIERVSSHLEQ